MKILVFIPTYNERENIGPLIEKVLSISKEDNLPLDILVLDDNSPDGTAEVVDELSRIYGNIYLVVRPSKMGLGSALSEGFAYAYENGYDLMVLMDADFQHPPEMIPVLVERILSGYNLVIASRYVEEGRVEGWSRLRRIISWGANLYARRFLGLSVKDLTSGFRAFDREALKFLSKCNFLSRGYALQVEVAYILHREGFKIMEVPFIFRRRRFGASKLGIGVMFEFFYNILRLRWRRCYSR